MRKAALLTVITLSLSITVAYAGPFNVKTGLWQVDMSRTSTGAPPLPPAILENMTPEQRAQFQAAMGARVNNPMAHSYKNCVTQKDLDDGFKMPDRPECKSQVLSKSSKGEKVRMDCQNQMGTMSMLMDWHILDREHATGTSETTMTGNNGQSMKSNGTFKAKWLSADCGNVQ